MSLSSSRRSRPKRFALGSCTCKILLTISLLLSICFASPCGRLFATPTVQPPLTRCLHQWNRGRTPEVDCFGLEDARGLKPLIYNDARRGHRLPGQTSDEIQVTAIACNFLSAPGTLAVVREFDLRAQRNRRWKCACTWTLGGAADQ